MYLLIIWIVVEVLGRRHVVVLGRCHVVEVLGRHLLFRVLLVLVLGF